MDFIKIYDNVFSKEQCSYYISLIQNGPQHPGRIAASNPKNAINSNIKISLDVNISEAYPNEVPYLIETIEKLMLKYQDNFKYKIPMKSCELFTGRKYVENEGFYKLHIDAGNAMTISRTVTVLIYLNFVNGGAIEFPLQEKIIYPAPGRVIMFPSGWTHPHQAFPSTKGDRYMMRTFIRACN